MTDDLELLSRFARERDEAAFAEVVKRNIDFVYRTALRQVNSDGHLAQDVTQAVFLQLARKAPEVAGHRVLAGWLHHATRFCARSAVRSERRWQKREQEAQTMINESRESPSSADWAQLHSVLDEVLQEIEASDREALLLRFYENRPYAELGARIGLAENTARMRVERALEKLRVRLTRRGITSTTAALAAAMTSQPAISAPAALTIAVVTSSLAGAGTAAVGGTATSTFFLMSTTKAVIFAAGVAALVATGYFAGSNRPAVSADSTSETRLHDLQDQLTRLRQENRDLRAEAARQPIVETTATVPAAPEPIVTAIVPYAPGVPVRLEANPLTQRPAASAVMNNLRQLGAAADQFRLENGRDPTFDDLVGEQKYIRAIEQVDSESYANLDFSKNGVLTVTTASGAVLSYPGTSTVSSKTPLQLATESAQAAFRLANGDRSPVGYELMEYMGDAPAREAYLDSVRVAALERAIDPGLESSLGKAAKAYDALYKGAYGTASPMTFAAFEAIASFIENDADRARYVAALRKIAAESSR